MTDYGRFLRKPPELEKLVDEALVAAVARGKRERQAVLKRVRRQRVMTARRLAAKYGRLRGAL